MHPAEEYLESIWSTHCAQGDNEYGERSEAAVRQVIDTLLEIRWSLRGIRAVHQGVFQMEILRNKDSGHSMSYRLVEVREQWCCSIVICHSGC